MARHISRMGTAVRCIKTPVDNGLGRVFKGLQLMKIGKLVATSWMVPKSMMKSMFQGIHHPGGIFSIFLRGAFAVIGSRCRPGAKVTISTFKENLVSTIAIVKGNPEGPNEALPLLISGF